MLYLSALLIFIAIGGMFALADNWRELFEDSFDDNTDWDWVASGEGEAAGITERGDGRLGSADGLGKQHEGGL